jgi:hypothetical protein
MDSNLFMDRNISPVDAFAQLFYHSPCLGGTSLAGRLSVVPAKSLTPEQFGDAKRLKTAFKAWQQQRKALGLPYSQDIITDGLGFGQSALSQYLNGHIPLNGDALHKICSLIGVNPGAISPRIAELETQKARQWLSVSNVLRLPVEDVSRGGLRKSKTQKGGGVRIKAR